MSRSILDLAGYSTDDPEVVEARLDTAQVADLIEGLVACRVANRLTQSDVAARLQTTQSAVSDIERVLGNPRLITLLRYARAVECRIQTEVEPAKDTAGWHHLKYTAAAGGASPCVGLMVGAQTAEWGQAGAPYFDADKARGGYALAA